MVLLNEEEFSSFMNSSTPKDIEIYFNSLILIKKHLDIDSKIPKKYVVKLYDEKPVDTPAYLVRTNAIGLEAKKLITNKHQIEDGGSDSDESKWFSFFSE